MRTYIGSRLGERKIVLVKGEDTPRELTPTASRKLWNHSTEFDWSYGGSGPAQLALALLLDHIGKTPIEKRPTPETAPVLAERFHQMFKGEFVEKFADRWTLTEEQIDGWLRQVVAQAQTKRAQYSHEPQFPKELGGTAT